jgi:hypothetical protein
VSKKLQLSLLSLLSTVAGAVALAGPAAATASAPAFDCKESVRAYCAYACPQGGVCEYRVDTCDIIDIDCY